MRPYVLHIYVLYACEDPQQSKGCTRIGLLLIIIIYIVGVGSIGKTNLQSRCLHTLSRRHIGYTDFTLVSIGSSVM